MSLSLPEFKSALADYRIACEPDEAQALFKSFDTNRDGQLNYDEFLMAVKGPMNERRQKIVMQAFRKLDKDGSGIVDIDDIKGVYNAGKHPDVKSGKKSEDQILCEFLDTFEMHYNMEHGTKDRKITGEEFVDYYSNVSASIDDDDYFDLMITNAWNLNNRSHAKGWAGEY